MGADKLLRKQVEAEIKKRRYVFYTLLLLSFLYVAVTLVIGERGLLRHIELKQKEAALKVEVDKMTQENDKLRAAISSYKENDFYLEKHARENFGLAEPGEYIYRYDAK